MIILNHVYFEILKFRPNCKSYAKYYFIALNIVHDWKYYEPESEVIIYETSSECLWIKDFRHKHAKIYKPLQTNLSKYKLKLI